MKTKSRPTMGDVAKYAGVSQPTVSNVINGVPGVSEASRVRVWKAVEELGYLPNFAARMLKTNQSKTIGVVVPDIESSYYTEIIKHIEEELRMHGYLIYLCNTAYLPELEAEYFSHLLTYHVDGVIICYGLISTRLYQQLDASGVPFVVLDGQTENKYPDILSVDIDNDLGSELAVAHLYNIGCRNICYVSEPLYNDVLQSRYKGYLHAMEKRGLPASQENIFIAHKQYTKIEMGFDIGTQILLNPTLDAVYVSSDYLAIGVLKRLTKARRKVPDDLLLVGYDDIFISDLITPTLTTVYQPKKEMAVHSARLLLNAIQQNMSGERHIYLSPHLVVRESSVRNI